MPDSGISDGSVYTSSFHDTYVRQQVVTQCTSATRPTGVEGRMIYETDTDRCWVYSGSAWVFQNYFSTAGRPGVILTDAAQSFTSATAADITWGTETSDVDGWTSGGSATVTVPTGWDGRYHISFNGEWQAGVTSYECRLLVNGLAVAEAVVATGNAGVPSISLIRTLAATDTIKINAKQTSGGAVNLNSRLEIIWLGR